KMLAVISQGRAIIREFATFAILKKGKGKSIIRLYKKDKLKFIELFRANQEITQNAGKRFIRIDSKNIETYYSDKPSGGG
ncbi:DNA topoisomerase IV subunit A, partial [Francisella tularensis subsp. holarctica]|nr:DNA topoisomerase IV subunit A [Francisella tularensis subsp. holarctica]